MVRIGFSVEYGSWKIIWTVRRMERRVEVGDSFKVGDVVSVDDDLSAGRALKAHQTPTQGRLARTRFTNNADALARSDFQGDTVECVHGPSVSGSERLCHINHRDEVAAEPIHLGNFGLGNAVGLAPKCVTDLR